MVTDDQPLKRVFQAFINPINKTEVSVPTTDMSHET